MIGVALAPIAAAPIPNDELLSVQGPAHPLERSLPSLQHAPPSVEHYRAQVPVVTARCVTSFFSHEATLLTFSSTCSALVACSAMAIEALMSEAIKHHGSHTTSLRRIIDPLA